MNEWTCQTCGLRFRTDTLTGAERMANHRDKGCDVPSVTPPMIVQAPGITKQPGVVGKRYQPRRKGANGY